MCELSYQLTGIVRATFFSLPKAMTLWIKKLFLLVQKNLLASMIFISNAHI